VNYSSKLSTNNSKDFWVIFDNSHSLMDDEEDGRSLLVAINSSKTNHTLGLMSLRLKARFTKKFKMVAKACFSSSLASEGTFDGRLVHELHHCPVDLLLVGERSEGLQHIVWWQVQCGFYCVH
jgi:hypothetical protein